MSCDWTEKVSLLVDGELAGGEADAARSHIEACDECRAARVDFLLFRRQISSYSAEASVAARRRALEAILSSKTPAAQARVREESGAWPSRAGWRERVAGAFARVRLAPAAALLALVVVALGLSVYMTSRRETQTARDTSFGTPSRESASATPSPSTRSDAPTGGGALKEKEDERVAENPSGKRVGENPSEKRAVVAVVRNTPPNAPRMDRRRRRTQSRDATQVIAATEPEQKSPRVEPSLENVGGATTASAAMVSDRARVAPLDAGRHAEQAQLLLRSFRNARLSDDDLAYERERSKRLLYRNIVLRREAASKGEARVEGLLDRLEPILIDIANLPDKPAKEEVASIRERVRKKNLVVSLQAAAPRRRDF
ncbi:MAG TPA: zf-HC2 domain-containing protein [Pyrinomonadaceae bacterium]|nr:zf-HC2 domain-containing protein [Pyrinomonadaceae bacterium]